MSDKGTLSACDHLNVARVAPLYVDGRPLYKCYDCDAKFVYEDDVPSYKALAPLRPLPGRVCVTGGTE